MQDLMNTQEKQQPSQVLVKLLTLVLFFAMVYAIVVFRFSPVVISVGMDYSRVEQLLLYAGGDNSEVTSSYSVSIPYEPGKPARDYATLGHNGNTMWHLQKLNMTIGAVFIEDKLIEIDVWDWTGRELDRYHHLIEYDSVDNLRIPILQGSYSAKLLSRENRGVNPPVR